MNSDLIIHHPSSSSSSPCYKDFSYKVWSSIFRIFFFKISCLEFILKQIFIYQKIIINKLLPKCLLYTFFEHCIILGWGSRSFIKSEHRGSYIMFKILGTRMVFILHHHPSSSIQCLSLCVYKPEMCKKVVHVYLPIIDVYIKFDFYRLCLQQPRSGHKYQLKRVTLWIN